MQSPQQRVFAVGLEMGHKGFVEFDPGGDFLGPRRAGGALSGGGGLRAAGARNQDGSGSEATCGASATSLSLHAFLFLRLLCPRPALSGSVLMVSLVSCAPLS